MAALDFPASPNINDSFTGPDNRRWVWNGSVWNLAPGVTGSSYSGLNTQSGTAYTFVTADTTRLTIFTSASNISATIPLNSVAPISVGAVLDIMQTGTGQVTVSGSVGVTIRTPAMTYLRAQYSTATAIKIATDEWVLVGDLGVT